MADVLTSTTNICCRPYLIRIFLTWWLDCWVDAGLFIILSDRHWTTSRPDSQKETAVSWVFYQITLAGRDGIIRQVGHRQNATRHKTTRGKRKNSIYVWLVPSLVHMRSYEPSERYPIGFHILLGEGGSDVVDDDNVDALGRPLYTADCRLAFYLLTEKSTSDADDGTSFCQI